PSNEQPVLDYSRGRPKAVLVLLAPSASAGVQRSRRSSHVALAMKPASFSFVLGGIFAPFALRRSRSMFRFSIPVRVTDDGSRVTTSANPSCPGPRLPLH